MATAQKTVALIGSTEYISFPTFKLTKILAKIDTGADSSAIWASNISLDKNTLSYSLFGQGSTYYSGEVIKTDQFRLTKVRNSFGQEEYRYKIKLSIKIGERKLISWFTLADRSNNTYPILLGKNFLRSRFVVDVSRKHVMNKQHGINSVVVISKQPKDNQEFFNKIARTQSVNTKYLNIGYESLIYEISNQQICIKVQPDGSDLASNDLVYIKTYKTNIDQAQAVADYLKFKSVRYVGQELNNNASTSKLSEYMRLSVNRLPIPMSIAATPKVLLQNYDFLVKKLGSPFVLKDSSSDRGKNNFLVAKRPDFDSILKIAKVERVYVAQKYIKSDGYLRVLVTGKEVSMAINRTSVSNKNPLKEHLNQPAGGLNASLLKTGNIPTEVKELAIRAAQIMGREIAGVDLLQDSKSRQWYILEANYDPQIRTGRFLDEKLKAVAKFLDDQLID
jgi:glutathione synthase/RimK-type ligase-like ATP-grasp enzyme